jgi:hypothetical protein
MNTTIAISKATRDLLLNYGKKSENYDDVIRRMYNELQMSAAIREFVDESGYSTLEEAREYARLKTQ